MGEDLWRSQHAEPQLNPQPSLQSYYPGQFYLHDQTTSNSHRQDSPADAEGPVVNGDEEPYTIKCICGVLEDDGNTVLCEQCNTWQHIDCYYFPSLEVPDIHKCNDCSPGHVDAVGAAHRQQQRLRELQNEGEDRKHKKSAQKSHKKTKTKDLNNAAGHTNGWPLADGYAFDRKSGSPRDQPPPAKRPKTSHKNSASLAGNLNNNRPVGHRHRSSSNLHGGTTSIKPPLSECPPDYLSPDFIHVHQNNTDFAEAQANTHFNIAMTNLLSEWLDDTDAFADATNGKTHDDVFKHFPQPIEELESPIRKNEVQDSSVRFHGSHPVWPYLTVERDLYAGDFVGELRGTIGHRDHYKADPANRWDKLRHPDHFVFFHPQLPIYIDCRSEGTLLRYARRSCRPNMKLETIITGEREYRFCFTALTELPSGTEITVSWDTQYDRQLQDCLTRTSNSPPMSEAQKAYVQDWVSKILAHFGGCACVKQSDSVCLMEHFDKRLGDTVHETNSRPAPKSSKKRKSAKRSPPSTGRATNSRAGSEAAPIDQDVDMDDNRSTSHSGKSPESRDGSPIGHGPHDFAGNELSERDKKKLIQQERLFDKMEQDQQVGKKKKRSSGSNLNTPTFGTTVSTPGLQTKPRSRGRSRQTSLGADTLKKQSGRRPSLSNPNTPAPGSKLRIGEGGASYFSPDAVQSPTNYSPPAQSPHKAQIPRKDGLQRSPLTKRPIYVEAGTQTEPEEPWDTNEPVVPIPKHKRKPYMTLQRKLLKRAFLYKAKEAAAKGQPPPIDLSQRPSLWFKRPSRDVPVGDKVNDVPMDNALQEQEVTNNPLSAIAASTQTPSTLPQYSEPSFSNPFKPPAPPTPVKSEDPKIVPQEGRNNFRSANLHVDLPPQTLPSSVEFSSPTAEDQSRGGPSSTGPSPFSPRQLPSLSMSASRNPSVSTTVAQPSPVKKKMSLSDYMNKRKTPSTEKSQSQSMQSGFSPVSESGSVKPDVVMNEATEDSSPAPPATAVQEDTIKQEEMATETRLG